MCESVAPSLEKHTRRRDARFQVVLFMMRSTLRIAAEDILLPSRAQETQQRRKYGTIVTFCFKNHCFLSQLPFATPLNNSRHYHPKGGGEKAPLPALGGCFFPSPSEWCCVASSSFDFVLLSPLPCVPSFRVVLCTRRHHTRGYVWTPGKTP